MRRLFQLVISCVLLSGCFGPGEGVEVPKDQIYFPVGLAMSKDDQYLYVVSSDFDLQYNAGAVQSYDLDQLSSKLPQQCRSGADCSSQVCDAGLCILDPTEAHPTPCPQGDRADADRLLFPGRCNPVVVTATDPDQRGTDGHSISPVASVKIGAFATDALLRQQSENGPERLFVPVRGDSTLHWIDLTDPTDLKNRGALECGQDNANGACDSQHRAGHDPSENLRGISLNAEPFAIDANENGSTIVVTNQTTGTASLFVNDWSSSGPLLKFALSSDRIPSRPVGIAALPRTQSDIQSNAAADDAFMMTFRNSAQVRLLRYAPDAESDPPRSYLVDGGGVPIDANSVGSDSRGIAVDPSKRKQAEARCNSDLECLKTAALVPLDVYVANRAPASLLIGRTRPPQEYPYFFASQPLTTGPSRVVVGQLTTPSGEQETRVFAICFDSRRIFVYDPARARVETEILTGRGPYAVAIDQKRSLLYVGHFTDSYIGVYSLDLAFPTTYGTLLTTLGTPKSPRASK